MSWSWYNLFSLTDFEETGLVSRTLTVELESIGQTDILITKGNLTSIQYDGVYLPINGIDGESNPYIGLGDEHGVFLDSDNNVWLGVFQ